MHFSRPCHQSAHCNGVDIISDGRDANWVHAQRYRGHMSLDKPTRLPFGSLAIPWAFPSGCHIYELGWEMNCCWAVSVPQRERIYFRIPRIIGNTSNFVDIPSTLCMASVPHATSKYLNLSDTTTQHLTQLPTIGHVDWMLVNICFALLFSFQRPLDGFEVM